MLESFINKLKDKNFITYRKIKELNKSQCKKSNLEVIDFDETKDKLVAHLCKIDSKDKPNPFCSCDCIKIINEKTRIDFIEIKGFKEFFARTKNVSGQKIKSKIEEFNFEKKIEDSFNIILLLHSFFDGRNQSRKVISQSERSFILLTDIEKSSIYSFTLTLKILEKFKNMKNVSDYKRKLFNEDEIEDYYKNLSK